MSEHTYFFNKIFKWQLYATVYISILQLVTIILLGRFLPYKELGSFALFQIVFRFALYTLDPGMFFSIIQKHELNGSLIKLLFRKQSLYIVFSIIGFWVLMTFTNTFHEMPMVVILNCIIIILLIGLGSYVQSRMVVEFKQREIVIAQMVSYSVELLFVVVFCTFYNPMVVFTFGVIVRFTLFYSICFVYVYFLQNKNEPTPPLNESIQTHISQSKFNIWSQILSFVQGQYDTVIILLLFGLPVLGGYILVTEISYMIFAKINPLFNKAIIPVVSKAHSKKSDTSILISESFVTYSYVIVILYVLFWNFRSELLQFAYPEKYLDLVYYATFLIPIAFFKAMNNILISYLVALSESKKVFYWNINILLLNYLIIAAFYFFKGSLNNFLILGLGYGVLSFLAVIYLLNRIFSKKSIVWTFSTLKLLGVILVMIILVFCIKLLISNFLLALFFSTLSIVGILFLFEKVRILKWFKLTIV